jgi:hypothetical protein
MMRITIKVVAFAFAICAMATSGSVGAKTPDKQVLDASSETALVVIKTDWWQPAPSMHSAFKLLLSTYDPAERKLLGKPFGGSVLIESKKKNFADGYLVASIKPGRWVFQSYSQQDKWALCFNAASWQFEVKSGEVVYLGEFDARSHREQLTEQAIASGKASIRGNDFADFFDLPDGPHLKAIDEAQLTAVREMLARRAPLVSAPVRAADYSPAIFGTGSTLFAERRCGGYFTTGGK